MTGVQTCALPICLFAPTQQEPASRFAPAAPTFSKVWAVAYKGTGYDRMRGAARARVAALGVLWSVDPSELGISAPQAVSELLQAGAVIARRDSDGSVYFRALGNDAQRIADLVSSKYSRAASSGEHTSELQSLMRISYDVFC